LSDNHDTAKHPHGDATATAQNPDAQTPLQPDDANHPLDAAKQPQVTLNQPQVALNHKLSADALPLVHVYNNPEEVARAVAGRFVRIAREATEARGRFSVALAGGSTPRRVYELLASGEWQSRVSWSRVHAFFGDERCVPPDHPESNYRMAHDALLSHVPIPPAQVHRMRGEGDAPANARLYEQELRAFFHGLDWPRFDLVMLGMGDDGHTASLFPNTPALHEQTAWVAANPVEKLHTTRLTLTPHAVNHAANILLTVTGATKAQRLQQVINGEANPELLPVQLVRPSNGLLEWFVDSAAAASLRTV
jgi:6-phosphogluconolactonase